MRRAISLIVLGAFLNLNVIAAFGQSNPSKSKSTNTPQRAGTPIFDHIPDNTGQQEEVLDPLLIQIPPAQIPVLENALGDVVHDSVVNILDLLRLRNIVLGRPPAPSAYELAEGDLNRDGLVNSADVMLLRDMLLRSIGVPSIVDSSGGDVSGAGVTMHFGSGEVDSNVVLRIDNQTAQDIEQISGADFSALAPDSTFFMTGFKVQSSNESFVYPPRMDIKLDQLPPCQLQGSNLLMTARRGPTGNTELVMLSPLQVAVDSTLLTPPPPIPVISSPQVFSKASASQIQQFEPMQLIEINVSNFSHILIGNVVYFSTPEGGWYPETPISFIPEDFQDFSQVTGILVPVAPLATGLSKIRVQHIGTNLTSNELEIEILPFHVPSSQIDSTISSVFAKIDSFLTLFASSNNSLFQTYPLNQLEANRHQLASYRPLIRQVRDSLLAANLIIRQNVVAGIENLGAEAGLDSAIAQLASPSPSLNNQSKADNNSSPNGSSPLLSPTNALKNTFRGAGLAVGVVGLYICVLGPT